ncbi:caspase recruitment domain-containing protein 8 isoform X1 [Alligator mississippiensis]|uniref:caspase recruitment domain-containing protein 8 isoform X1 n=1 Tax=Alligator mississippiensis TaxID=8496 RepID=UPI0028775F87|nr:caspase recruitment domain-containing protein 8 isoform X1 [Alligator mississippiensis]
MSSLQRPGPLQPSGDDTCLSEEKESYSDKEEDSAQECKSDDRSESNSENGSESESDNEQSDTRQSDEVLEKGELLPRGIESEVNSQSCCEHCKTEHIQKEQVTPRRFSGEQFWLKLEAEGSYQCAFTSLIFEVSKPAEIKYNILSWSKYADYIKKPWIVGGPLFNVSCDSASALTSIQFPHSLCLHDHGSNMTFKVLHIKSTGPSIEPSVDHSSTHIKWHVSSLSPVGPVIQTQEPVDYHGAVILYKVVDNHPSLSFRVYIATNNESFIKDISKAIRHSDKKFIKIDKPPVCQKLLQNGKRYRLISEPEADIIPEEMQFVDGSLLKLKSYIEVYLEQPVEFTLSLVELESEVIVWKAKLREWIGQAESLALLSEGWTDIQGNPLLNIMLATPEPMFLKATTTKSSRQTGDWTKHNQNNNEQKRKPICRRRRSSISLSDEELCNKRLKGIPDETKAKSTLTDQQLMTIAQKMGKDWKEIAIGCLNLEMKDIDQIQEKEEEVNIYKFRMLNKWRESEQNNGTAQNLYDSLRDHVSYEVQQVLKGFLEHV